ncbi:MAG: sugar ABC transporter substrate-binding protein [Hyphomicrobiales bacterium]|nr:MAG: sugar ABC transporter substrate-binding protein [Hyphomicrobiales bacterium]
MWGRKLAIASFTLTTALTSSAMAQQTEIRIMAVDAYANAWQTTLVPEFEKAHPDIKVTIDATFGPEMLAKQMLDAIAPVPVYDIIFPDDPWVPQLAEIGALVDLKGPEIAAMTDPDYDWADFNATPLAAGEWQGKQYAIPVRSNMLMMFYNRALYEKAGLPAPTPELTWDEFFEQAPKLVQDTNGDGQVDAWAIDTLFNRDGLTPTVWQTIMNSYGGNLLDDAGKPTFNNEVGVKALEMQKRLLDYAPPGALAHGFAESLQAFRQGQVAVLFTWGSVYRATATDANVSNLTNGEVGMQILPVGTVSGGAHRGIWSAGIASKSPNKEAAWTFLQWLTSKEGERTNSQLVGSFPARNSTLEEGARDPWQEAVFPALRLAYDTAAGGKMWRIRSPKSDATQAIQADEVSRFFSGAASAEDALNSAAAQIAEVLE